MGDEVASDLEVLHLEGDVELALAAAMAAAGILRCARTHRRNAFGSGEGEIGRRRVWVEEIRI